MWWIGTRKGLFAVRDGVIEGPTFPGVPVTLVLASGSTVWAAVEHGHYGPKIHRSDDGGRTFAEVGTPAFPEGAGASVSTVWELALGPDGRLWCGTIPGGLFTSDDRGDSWVLVQSLWDHPSRSRWFGGGADQPGIHSVCVDPRDPQRVLAGVSCGGAWRSTDGGATWEVSSTGMVARFMPPERQDDPDIQDPHRIDACAAHPDVLWCQHHNGVWRSTDGGALWVELTVPPSSFGFAVAAHPTDPDTAWFVPAIRDDQRMPVDGAVVVSRTRDGGRTFDVLRAGLPQVHAYDLVFRHGLAVDATGRRLAFGSTTGSVWETRDGGDSWSTVSQHLPPVYCVRPG